MSSVLQQLNVCFTGVLSPFASWKFLKFQKLFFFANFLCLNIHNKFPQKYIHLLPHDHFLSHVCGIKIIKTLIKLLMLYHTSLFECNISHVKLFSNFPPSQWFSLQWTFLIFLLKIVFFHFFMFECYVFNHKIPGTKYSHLWNTAQLTSQNTHFFSPTYFVFFDENSISLSNSGQINLFYLPTQFFSPPQRNFKLI